MVSFGADCELFYDNLCVNACRQSPCVDLKQQNTQIYPANNRLSRLLHGKPAPATIVYRLDTILGMKYLLCGFTQGFLPPEAEVSVFKNILAATYQSMQPARLSEYVILGLSFPDLPILNQYIGSAATSLLSANQLGTKLLASVKRLA